MCVTPPCFPRPRCFSTLVALLWSEGASMEIGDRVEVHTRFNNAWVTGFEVAAVVDSGYRLCRTSDGTVLPSVTSESDLRPEPPDKSAHAIGV
jgi:hypothetical protein